jgi:hypothetical protein
VAAEAIPRPHRIARALLGEAMVVADHMAVLAAEARTEASAGVVRMAVPAGARMEAQVVVLTEATAEAKPDLTLATPPNPGGVSFLQLELLPKSNRFFIIL